MIKIQETNENDGDQSSNTVYQSTGNLPGKRSQTQMGNHYGIGGGLGLNNLEGSENENYRFLPQVSMRGRE